MLLRLVSWPYFREHLVRMLLTTAGVVLGVAVFVAVHTANQSILSVFNTTVDRIAGSTELQVSAGETGFAEDVLETVQASPAVRVAVPVIEAVVDSGFSGQGSLLVLGTDMTGDRSLREYDFSSSEDVIEDPLVFLAQPDSIILTKEFADRNHLVVNSRLTLGTAFGDRQFTIRGLMKPSPLASAFGGNLAVMDIYAAQSMFGRGRTFDRIDVAARPGFSLETTRSELQRRLGPGFQVEPPSGRGQQFESMIAAYSMMIDICSVFALLIGMFIIYNSFEIAVTERRSEIGILRALGATRRQIAQVFVTEGAVIGVLGSIVGLLFGLTIARVIAAEIGSWISDFYGVAQPTEAIVASPAVLGSAMAIGVVTSVFAALIPARQAARIDPVLALQKGKYQLLAVGESHARAAIAAVAGIVSIGCALAGGSRVLFYLGYVLALSVGVLLAPIFSLALSRMLRPLLRWIRPVEGALAADSLIQAPRRTSASVVAVMLSLALVITFAGMARASYGSIVEWVDTQLNPDLFIMPSQDVMIRSVRFPDALEPELAAIDGVAHVQGLRNARVIFKDTPVMVIAINVSSLAQTSKRRPVAGDPDGMYRQTAAGEGLMISDNLAERHRLRLGDVLELPAPGGVIRLPVVGILVDYSDQQGTIFMDRSLFKTYWRDDSVNAFRVYLHPGTPLPEVKRRILARFAGRRQVFVLTNSELRSYILRVTDQWFALSSVQIAVAVLVAILGIVNTLTVSIADRRRELGTLKAVGGLRNQIRRTVWMEALAIAAIGLALGYLAGAANLYYMLQIVHRDIAGLRLEYKYPVTVTLALIPTMLGAAFVAAIWPAEWAVRSSVVEALEYE